MFIYLCHQGNDLNITGQLYEICALRALKLMAVHEAKRRENREVFHSQNGTPRSSHNSVRISIRSVIVKQLRHRQSIVHYAARNNIGKTSRTATMEQIASLMSWNIPWSRKNYPYNHGMGKFWIKEKIKHNFKPNLHEIGKVKTNLHAKFKKPKTSAQGPSGQREALELASLDFLGLKISSFKKIKRFLIELISFFRFFAFKCLWNNDILLLVLLLEAKRNPKPDKISY